MNQYILKEESGTKITVRDVQKVLLPILLDIDKICKKHDIPYFLIAGTCLGAVRHHGFIPWDDDLDIGMMRSDYERFIEVLKQDLPNNYVFQCFDTHKEYNVTIPAMKIRKKGTFVREKNILLENKCPDGNGLFVDVFIYDYVSENKIVDLCNRIPECLSMPVIGLLENMKCNPVLLKEFYMNHAKRYGMKHENSGRVGMAISWVYERKLRPKIHNYDDIFPLRYMDFEGYQLPVPNKIHEFLCVAMGSDYMTPPPVAKRAPKHILDIELDPARASFKEAEYQRKHRKKRNMEIYDKGN